VQVWQLAASLYAVNNGYLDDVDTKKVLAFEKGLHDFLKTKHSAWVDEIESKKEMSSDAEAALKAAIAEFKKTGAY
jgi:F-type H+-transporting ATPase subunit alpha